MSSVVVLAEVLPLRRTALLLLLPPPLPGRIRDTLASAAGVCSDILSLCGASRHQPLRSKAPLLAACFRRVLWGHRRQSEFHLLSSRSG